MPVQHFHIGQHRILDAVVFLELCDDRRLSGTVGQHRILQNELCVIHGDTAIVKLLIDDSADGIIESEARQQQGCAARHAKRCHQEATLVTEDIAHCHLRGEVQMLPDKRDLLQQHTLARLGRARAHQLRRAGGQLLIAGEEGSPHCGKDRNRRANERIAQDKLEMHRR